jgi:hypothetical protein
VKYVIAGRQRVETTFEKCLLLGILLLIPKVEGGEKCLIASI